MRVASLRDHAVKAALLCRLNRPVDLLLILPALLQGSWLAAGGLPEGGTLLLLLLSATLFRCAVWCYNDLLEQRLMKQAPESLIGRGRLSGEVALMLTVGLLLAATLLLAPLGWSALGYGGVALLLALGYPFLKLRSFLIQPYMALAIAWAVPVAYAALGVAIDRAGWLLMVANLLFATAALTLYALPRRDYEQRVGIRSLVQLVGETGSRVMLPLLQFTALFALSLVAKQAKLGPLFDSALWVVLGLILYQALMLNTKSGSGNIRLALQLQLWMGVALFGGLLFHTLCVCS